MRLENKHILITAGPTWIPIDKVRVISNTATGTTGILLAEKLAGLGAKVTLLLGPAPANATSICRDSIICCPYKVISFRFFDELKVLFAAELRSGRYDAVIHSAAVSDYRPLKPRRQKIRSGLKNLRLDLVPTEKIIDSIKKRDSSLYLVGFKFEPSSSRVALIREAAALARRVRADLVVANTTLKDKYRAYIVGGTSVYGPLTSKAALVKMLAGLMEKGLCESQD